MERTVYADVHPVVWQDICKMKPCTNWKFLLTCDLMVRKTNG